jgi:hypothetical protein
VGLLAARHGRADAEAARSGWPARPARSPSGRAATVIELEWSVVAVLAAVLSVAMSVLAFSRQGRWRDSEDAKSVAAQLESLRIRGAETEGRVKVLETRVDGEVQRLDGLIDRLETAVMRVEDIARAG